MNMPVLKESERPSWIVGIAAVVLSVALTFLSTNYFNQNNETRDRNQTVEVQLRAHELAIATLKISVENIADAQRRTENSIAAIEQTQTSILGTLQSLKDSNDAQSAVSANIRDQFLDLRKQLADIDTILRPLNPRH